MLTRHPPSWIFKSFKILTAIAVCSISMHHHAKFRANWSFQPLWRCRHFLILFFLAGGGLALIYDLTLIPGELWS